MGPRAEWREWAYFTRELNLFQPVSNEGTITIATCDIDAKHHKDQRPQDQAGSRERGCAGKANEALRSSLRRLLSHSGYTCRK